MQTSLVSAGSQGVQGLEKGFWQDFSAVFSVWGKI
jgi:hypothetical protein